MRYGRGTRDSATGTRDLLVTIVIVIVMVAVLDLSAILCVQQGGIGRIIFAYGLLQIATALTIGAGVLVERDRRP